MLHLACTIGSYLARETGKRPWLLPIFLLYLYAFALVARAWNLVKGIA